MERKLMGARWEGGGGMGDMGGRGVGGTSFWFWIE